MIKAAVLLVLLAIPALAGDHPLPPPPAGPRADYSAERAEFDGEKSMLHLSGGVVVKESTWTVKGEDLWIDIAQRKGRSDGPLLVEDGISALYGDSGEFDFGAHTGRLYQTDAGHGDWRIHARQGAMDEKRRVDYRGASFSSCSKHPPHYHFRASSISVIPRKRLIAYNTVFYLGKVPVFYLPILYKSLAKKHFLRWKSQPGFDRRNGPFLKNTLTTDHSDTVYSKLFLDYYSKQGLGAGGELMRREGEDSRGALFGYGIKEDHNGAKRWAMLGQQYQALGSTATAFQARLQIQSDPDFNNHYARSNTFRVTPELINGGAIVHRFSQSTARLSYSRLDTAEGGRGRFLKTKESYPRLEYQTAPLRLGRTPWLNTFDAFADNAFDSSRSYIEKSVSAGWEAVQTIPLARGVSLTPKGSFRETYYNRLDYFTVAGSSVTTFDAVVGRWGVGGTLRFDTFAGGWDLSHSYKKRLKEGAFTTDTEAVDKGVEENLLTLSDVFMPAPRMWARLSSGYDFRTYRGYTVGFRRRVQPIVAETSWSPSEKLSLSLRNDYQLEDGNRAFIADARWGDEEGAAVGGGLAYNQANPGSYVASLNFAIAPSSPTWRLSFGLRADAYSPGSARRLQGFRVFEKEFAWSKNWHDFHTRIAGRFRPGGVGEASIRIDLKFGEVNPKDAKRRDWESEMFPQRKGDEDLRP